MSSTYLLYVVRPLAQSTIKGEYQREWEHATRTLTATSGTVISYFPCAAVAGAFGTMVFKLTREENIPEYEVRDAAFARALAVWFLCGGYYSHWHTLVLKGA
ncbi:hypothetical protein BDQ17DRAFT_1347066 [Cyathus striatus]|nr:hypothetical protein BDQ17DRAFT_1347066 [Cyathus striatus]